MDARAAVHGDDGNVANHVQFNQDFKYFTVALETGFSIFKSENCDLYLEQDVDGSVGTTSMLGNSQIVGLTSGGTRTRFDANKLVLWDSIRRQQTASITTRESIIQVFLSNEHVALVMERTVNVYKHQPKIIKLATYETVQNPLGLCCLGQRTLAIPGRSAGQIQLIDLASGKVSIMPAHSSALRALALSPEGDVVASASATGTLIRVYSVRDCSRLAEMRRGVGTATIYSIAIAPSGGRLAVTSDSSTLHIFDIPNRGQQAQFSGRDAPSASARGSERSPSPPTAALINNVQKWGSLAKLPFAPRVFTDVYSFASTTFDSGKEDPSFAVPALAGLEPRIPPKGVLGWLDEETIVVISAGQDARYERFALVERDGKAACGRVGWSRFQRPN